MSCWITTAQHSELWLTAMISSRSVFQYTVYLSKLDSHSESQLRGGAFARFSRERQTHDVIMPVVSGINEVQMREVLDWIAVNVQCTWSFTLDMRNASEGGMRWSFANASDAVLFKLTCRNPSCEPIESDVA